MGGGGAEGQREALAWVPPRLKEAEEGACVAREGGQSWGPGMAGHAFAELCWALRDDRCPASIPAL